MIVLVDRHRRAFASGSAWNQPRRSFADLPVDKGDEGLFIEPTIAERRHKRRDRTAKHGIAPSPRTRMRLRSEEHTSELQSLMRNSYAVFCLTKTKNHKETT